MSFGLQSVLLVLAVLGGISMLLFVLATIEPPADMSRALRRDPAGAVGPGET